MVNELSVWEIAVEGVHNLGGRGNHAAHAAVVSDGHAAVDGEAHVLDHLAGVEFDGEDSFDAPGECGDGVGGEWPEGDRAQEADFQAFFTGFLDGFEGDACDGAEGDDEVFAVVRELLLEADFVGADEVVGLL